MTHPPFDPSAPTPEKYREAVAIARALIPQGQRVPGADLETVMAAERLAADMSASGKSAFRLVSKILDWAAVLRTGKRFHQLDGEAQERVLRKWEHNPLERWALFGLAGVLKSVHGDSQKMFEAWGQDWKKGGPPEEVRWLGQVESGEDWDDDEALECDVVVIGSGPGGAIVGKELAELGHAVVFVEEGKHYRRDAFTGSSLHAHHTFYRGQGAVAAVGNTAVPVLMGRLVGGSTAINTGTSFRTPEWILNEWCEKQNSEELSPVRMQRHFERVERTLEIAPNEDKVAGPIRDIVARGCEKLGWSHYNVPRNAPDCDAQACCDFGCPSGARKSMDVSYLPKAFARGAMLFSSTKAQRIIIENGRAVGIVARSVERQKRIEIRAQIVVLAGGAVPSPVLLLNQRICNSSGQLGRNLTLHPGAVVTAQFPDLIEPYKYIPQSVCIDQFHREGIMLLGAQAPLNMVSHFFPFHGRRLSAALDAYDHMTSLGVLVKDATQNGVVRAGFKGEPLITYWLTKKDLALTHRGAIKIMELFFAAGATRCFPNGHRFPTIESRADLDSFGGRHIGPADYLWTSFHPLGTAQMGINPKRTVVDFDHQTHDVPGLFIVDGSTVPGATAVNPQLTIMAMADRAAERIAKHLE